MHAAGWRAVLALAALLALPLAWGAARLGYGLAVGEPLRDLALLLLWSVAEEVVFRGGLQAWLQRRLPGPAHAGITRANLVTSLVFAAAHLATHPWPAALGVLPVSLLLGASFERSGGLRVPIVLHAWFNACLYAASWWLARG